MSAGAPRGKVAATAGFPVGAAAAAAEGACDVVYLAQVRPELRVEYISPSVEALTGFTPAEFAADPLLALRRLDPRDVDAVTGLLAGTAGESIDATVRWRCRDGRTMLAQHRSRLVQRDDGSVVIDGVAREVTAERLAFARLSDAHDQLDLVLRHTTEVLLRYAVDGTVLWASPSLQRVFGWDPADVVGTRFRLSADADLAKAEAELRAAVAAQRETVDLRERVRCADGTVRWADMTVRFVRETDGTTPAFSVASVRDVTSEVEAQHALATSERAFRLLAENSSDVVLVVDRTACITWVSPSVAEAFGWAERDLMGACIRGLIHPDDLADELVRKRTFVGDVGTDLRGEFRVRTKDGRWRWVGSNGRALRDDHGTVVGGVESWRDITAEVEARHALTRSEQRFRLAMEFAPSGMAVISLDRQFLEVNPALCRMLGRTESWLREHRIDDLLEPEEAGIDRGMRDAVMAGVTSSQTCEHTMITADGSLLWVQHAIALLRDDDGTPLSYVSQFVDITAERRTREALRFRASHDPLTRLANRDELMSRLTTVLSHPPRGGGRTAVLFLDVDGLKDVNDGYGHDIGDAVLVAVADRLTDRVRTDDVVARLGGDEFVVVLPSVRSVADARAVATSLHQSMAEAVTADDLSVPVTISVGLALAGPGDDAPTVLRRADIALYRAKRTGRDRTVVFDDVDCGVGVRVDTHDVADIPHARDARPSARTPDA